MNITDDNDRSDMGYNTRVSGEIQITPPITYREMQAMGLQKADLSYADKNLYYLLRERNYADVAVRVELQMRDTDEGVLTAVAGIAIVPAWEDEFKAYTIEEDLRALVNALAKASPGIVRTFHGRLDGEGRGKH
jgi:hypothetical protein